MKSLGSLKISPGNLSYHFKTKGDLVAALIEELHELNTAANQRELPPPGPELLFEFGVRSFTNDWAYRGIAGSFADAILLSTGATQRERELHGDRIARVKAVFLSLRDAGVFREDIVEIVEDLAWVGRFVGRFFVAEARLHYPDTEGEKIVRIYALRTVSVLAPMFTEAYFEEFLKLRERVNAELAEGST